MSERRRHCEALGAVQVMVSELLSHPSVLPIFLTTAMTSFSLHFSMANSNSIACFVGLPSHLFTN